MSKPLTRAMPEVGGTSVVSIRISVDLPAPFGPSRPKTSPWLHFETQAVHGNKIAEPLRQIFDFDGGMIHVFPTGSIT